MRHLSRIGAAAIVATIAAPACRSQTPIVSEDGAIRIVRNDVGSATAQRLAERMAGERRRVRAWWGDGFPAPIRVAVAEEFNIAMALIPAWRGDHGRMELPVRTIMQDATPTVHELVHIEAPNGNRFLAEGLAVHLQALLDGVPAFPNFGRDLHLSARAAARRARIAALDAAATPTSLTTAAPELDPRTAYLVAGSFVRFLIDVHGKERFRRLYALTPFEPRKHLVYDPKRYRSVYGIDLSALEQGWRRLVAR